MAAGNALDRGLDLLEALQSAPEGLGYAELRRRVPTSPASFGRFLKILHEREYLRQDDAGRYRLGWRLAALGAGALEQSSLRSVARPHLLALARLTEESAEAAEFVRGEFVFVDRVESSRSVVLQARPGSRFHAGDTTAIGRLALAFDAGDPAETLSGRVRARVRRAQFCAMLQNRREAYRAAAPVFDARGRCVGCLAIAAPAFRVGAKEKKRFRRLLLEHAAAASNALGGSGAADADSVAIDASRAGG